MRSIAGVRLVAVCAFAVAAGAAACSGGRSLVPTVAGGAARQHARPHASCIAGYSGGGSTAGAGGWPVQIIDKSGLSVKSGYPAIYVTYGSPPQYMTSTGTLKNLPSAPATVPPLSVSKLCVPAKNKPLSGFNLNPGGSGRLYIAYAPLTLNSANQDPSGNLDKSGSTNYSTLFDWYEFDAGNTFFVSNVQAYMFALPMQLLALDSGGRYYSGGFNNQYGNIVSAYEKAASPWNTLVLKNNGSVLRVMSPGNVGSFPDVFKSFISTVGSFYAAQYKANPKGIVYAPMALTVPGNTKYGTCLPPPTPKPGAGYITACPLYTVNYSSNNFVFTLETPAPSLPANVSFPKTIKVPAADFVNSLTFGADIPVALPPVPGGSPTASQWNTYLNGAVEFYLIKYMANDLDRGVATVTPAPKAVVAHPLIPSCMQYDNSPPCIATNYYPSKTSSGGANTYDTYSFLLHKYAVNEYAKSAYPWPTSEPGGAYGAPYEDTWSQSSTVTIPYASGPTVQYLKVCIHPVVKNGQGDCF